MCLIMSPSYYTWGGCFENYILIVLSMPWSYNGIFWNNNRNAFQIVNFYYYLRGNVLQGFIRFLNYCNMKKYVSGVIFLLLCIFTGL